MACPSLAVAADASLTTSIVTVNARVLSTVSLNTNPTLEATTSMPNVGGSHLVPRLNIIPHACKYLIKVTISSVGRPWCFETISPSGARATFDTEARAMIEHDVSSIRVLPGKYGT